MIINYRVEMCRACYHKRTRRCRFSDQYIVNSAAFREVKTSGECRRYLPVPWLPEI